MSAPKSTSQTTKDVLDVPGLFQDIADALHDIQSSLPAQPRGPLHHPTEDRLTEPRQRKKTGLAYMQVCKFFYPGQPDGCRNGNICRFLHIDPDDPRGCPNIPSNIFQERWPIIRKHLARNWPRCALLSAEMPIRQEAKQEIGTLPKNVLQEAMKKKQEKWAEESRKEERQKILTEHRKSIQYNRLRDSVGNGEVQQATQSEVMEVINEGPCYVAPYLEQQSIQSAPLLQQQVHMPDVGDDEDRRENDNAQWAAPKKARRGRPKKNGNK